MKTINRTTNRFTIKNILLILITLSVLAALGYFLKFAIAAQQEEQQLRVEKSIQTQQLAQDRENAAMAKYQIQINEIHHDGATGSIIELYNPTEFPVSLEDYSLTNNSHNEKYVFPSDTTIQANDFIVITQEDIAINFDGTDYISLKSDGNELLDFVSIPHIPVNESYGRLIEVDKKYNLMTASIASSNATSIIIKKEYPVLSVPSGFYNDPFSLEITAKEGYTLYYTTDGSIPDEAAIEYSKPIPIDDASKIKAEYALRTDLSIYPTEPPASDVDKATIIRVIAIDGLGHKSDVITATYFVGFQKKSGYEALPILSIVSDPEGLFGYWDGIYVTGNTYDNGLLLASELENGDNDEFKYANYLMDWERAGYYELFESSGMITNSGNIILSTYDDGYLDYAQKSLQLRGVQVSEGPSTFDMLLNDQGNSETFVLSSGRNDYHIKLREMLISKLMDNSKALTEKVTPVIVFLDGEYWGLYNMVLPYGPQLIADAYDLNPNEMVIMNNQLLIEMTDEGPVLKLADPVIAGSLSDQEDYLAMIRYVLETDLVPEAAYDVVASMMDIQSFIDMSVCMLYTGNSEWLEGKQYIWRSNTLSNQPYEDGKWRWILTNTESAIGLDTLSSYKMNSFIRPALTMDILFNRLLENEAFRKQFVTTFLEDAENRFSVDQVTNLLAELSPLYNAQIMNSYERYYGGSNTDLLLQEVMVIEAFFKNRMEYMWVYLNEQFEATGELDDLVIN